MLRSDYFESEIKHLILGKTYPSENKTFRVKMRIVGNSYAVSIPKEIVDFMHEQERMMDDMVRLVFNDARKLSLSFGDDEDEEDEVAVGKISYWHLRTNTSENKDYVPKILAVRKLIFGID